MNVIPVKKNDTVGANRIVWFRIVSQSGAVAPSQAGQFPYVWNGTAWVTTVANVSALTDTGTGGWHYATVVQSIINVNAGTRIKTRYYTDDIGEIEGDTLLVVNYDPYTGATGFQTQLTENYPAVGVVPTPEQALLMILALLGNSKIIGSSFLALKLDGSNTGMTYALDAPNNPQSKIRTS